MDLSTNDVSRTITFIERFLFEEGIITIIREDIPESKIKNSGNLYWRLTDKGRSFFLHQSLDEYISNRIAFQEREERQENINVNQSWFNKIIAITSIATVIIALLSLLVSIRQFSN